MNQTFKQAIQAELDRLSEIDADDCGVPDDLEVLYAPPVGELLAADDHMLDSEDFTAEDERTGWSCPCQLTYVGVSVHEGQLLLMYSVKYDASKAYRQAPERHD